MDILSGTSALIPLPAFPSSFGLGDRKEITGLRPFGISEVDLCADFASADRAALVTYILGSCLFDPGGVLSAEFFRELSIGKRIECLLVLASGGSPAPLEFPFNCPGCSEAIGLEFTLNEISMLQNEADSIDVVGVDIRGRRLEFRKPTGRHQELLAEIALKEEQYFDFVRELIATLAMDRDTGENIRPDDFVAIEAAMLEADPLVDFSCDVRCSECGMNNILVIDLMETALDRLRQAQGQLIVMIHRLASQYHWSEKEVFEVPHWRRIMFLELIGTGKK